MSGPPTQTPSTRTANPGAQGQKRKSTTALLQPPTGAAGKSHQSKSTKPPSLSKHTHHSSSSKKQTSPTRKPASSNRTSTNTKTTSTPPKHTSPGSKSTSRTTRTPIAATSQTHSTSRSRGLGSSPTTHRTSTNTTPVAAGSSNGASQSSNSSSGLSSGEIAAAAVVPIVVVAAILALVLLYLRRRQNRSAATGGAGNSRSSWAPTPMEQQPYSPKNILPVSRQAGSPAPGPAVGGAHVFGAGGASRRSSQSSEPRITDAVLPPFMASGTGQDPFGDFTQDHDVETSNETSGDAAGVESGNGDDYDDGVSSVVSGGTGATDDDEAVEYGDAQMGEAGTAQRHRASVVEMNANIPDARMPM